MPAAGTSVPSTVHTPSIPLRAGQDGEGLLYTNSCYSAAMVKADELYDITVVGAGPVGLYAAYYAGLRECRTKLIEMYPQVGGRLISMYPEKEIFDVAGHPKILAAELIRLLTEQAMQYRPSVVLNERVTELRVLGE